jgi:hypothetical protein
VSEDEDFQTVVWTGAAFLAKGKSCWISEDGLAWKADPRKLPGDLGFGREGEGGIAFSWGGNLFFSPDFLTWKKAALPAGPSFNAAVWGGR